MIYLEVNEVRDGIKCIECNKRIKGAFCTGCIFVKEKGCSKYDCTNDFREDGKDVIFIREEE